MTAIINAFARGGFGCYGPCSYDQRADVVVVQASNAEITNVTITFAETISSVNYDADGIETSEPAITAKTMTVELSNFHDGDRIRYDVMLSTGEMKQVSLEIAGPSSRALVSSGGDYGSYP